MLVSHEKQSLLDSEIQVRTLAVMLVGQYLTGVVVVIDAGKNSARIRILKFMAEKERRGYG